MNRRSTALRPRRREARLLSSSLLLLLAPLLLGASCDPRECAEDSSLLLLTAPAGHSTIRGGGVPLKVDAFGSGVVYLRADGALLSDAAGDFVTRCLPLGEQQRTLCDERDGGGVCDVDAGVGDAVKSADAGASELLFPPAEAACLAKHSRDLWVRGAANAPPLSSHRAVVYASLHRDADCDDLGAFTGHSALPAVAQATLEIVFEPETTASADAGSTISADAGGDDSSSDGGSEQADAGEHADLDAGTTEADAGDDAGGGA